MYMVIRRYEADPGDIDEITKRVQGEFLPMISRSLGFISYYVVASREGEQGVVTSVSIFESKPQAEESTRMANDWAHRRLTPLILNPPEVISGVIAVAEARAGVR